MNARDGMRRLHAERRLYGLCVRCGVKLEAADPHMYCPECREAERQR